MNMIVNAVESGFTTKKELISYLSESEVYAGIGDNISFRENENVNLEVNILQFQDGNIFKINQ